MRGPRVVVVLVALLGALPGVAMVDEARALAEEPLRHVVEAGDSCSSIAQHYYGDTRFVDLLHAANPELARRPPPHVLVAGTVLVIPPKPAPRTGPDAQLTAVRNHVDVLTPGQKPGKANDPLFRGNRVSTQAASAADVTFRDETQVKLGERTLVIILGDARSAAARIGAPAETQTTLVTGNLRAFMAGISPTPSSSRGPAAVATDAAAVKVYDGEAQVSADAVKTTRLSVYRGSSAIDARGTRREVPRGFGSKAELGQPPSVPRPLPPAPVWTTRPSLVLLDQGTASIAGEYDVPPAGAHGSTPPVAAVASWHVQIARDGIFRDVAVDTTAPVGVRRLEVRPPGPGRYYIRVSSVDDDHFEGPYGVIARVMVVKAIETALPNARRRIELEPPDAFCVRVGNVPLARVDGPILAAVTEPVRLRCAPSESDPTTLIALD